MLHDTITVTLIDDAASATLGAVDLPIASLPDTFDLETTLNIGDAEWSVVHADPRTKPEFAQTGQLVVRLRKVEMVDLSNILFSLPSVCDRLPAIHDAPRADADLVLAEDDWRQIELVSRAFASDSDAEITAIRAIHEHEREPAGWRKVHIRKHVDPPIAATLSLSDFKEAFGAVTFQSVCFGDSPIVGGFSFRSGDLECYGIEEDGAITVLALARANASQDTAETLARLAHRFDLELVHWCRCARLAWDHPLFGQLLTGAV